MPLSQPFRNKIKTILWLARAPALRVSYMNFLWGLIGSLNCQYLHFIDQAWYWENIGPSSWAVRSRASEVNKRFITRLNVLFFSCFYKLKRTAIGRIEKEGDPERWCYGRKRISNCCSTNNKLRDSKDSAECNWAEIWRWLFIKFVQYLEKKSFSRVQDKIVEKWLRKKAVLVSNFIYCSYKLLAHTCKLTFTESRTAHAENSTTAR